MRVTLGVACALTVFCCSLRAAAPETVGSATEFSPLVKRLLSELTLEEKTELNTGAREPVYAGQAGYTAGLPRLGIPSLRWANTNRQADLLIQRHLRQQVADFRG